MQEDAFYRREKDFGEKNPREKAKEIWAKMERFLDHTIDRVRKNERGRIRKIEHICVNITNHSPIDRMKSQAEQVLEYYQKRGWELCAVDDIYYFFKRSLTPLKVERNKLTN